MSMQCRDMYFKWTNLLCKHEIACFLFEECSENGVDSLGIIHFPMFGEMSEDLMNKVIRHLSFEVVAQDKRV